MRLLNWTIKNDRNVTRYIRVAKAAMDVQIVSFWAELRGALPNIGFMVQRYTNDAKVLSMQPSGGTIVADPSHAKDYWMISLEPGQRLQIQVNASIHLKTGRPSLRGIQLIYGSPFKVFEVNALGESINSISLKAGSNENSFYDALGATISRDVKTGSGISWY
jgi:hypothetical protein